MTCFFFIWDRWRDWWGWWRESTLDPSILGTLVNSPCLNLPRYPFNLLQILKLNGWKHDNGLYVLCLCDQVVQETIDPDAKIEYRPNTEDDPHKRKPDITKAKDLLGWEPKVSLRKGLPLMVSDFRQRIFGDHKDTSGGGANTAA